MSDFVNMALDALSVNMAVDIRVHPHYCTHRLQSVQNVLCTSCNTHCIWNTGTMYVWLLRKKKGFETYTMWALID